MCVVGRGGGRGRKLPAAFSLCKPGFKQLLYGRLLAISLTSICLSPTASISENIEQMTEEAAKDTI